MSHKIQCATHGECLETFVCTHLLGERSGLGFNRDHPSDENPFPDAWCDDCEIIRASHGGWSDESKKLVKISLLCSGCYQRSRIRNLRTSVTLNDLRSLRWKCGGCDEWHTGACLDFGYSSPYYWTDADEKKNRKLALLPSWSQRNPATFLDEDFCAIDDEHFFVRGLIHLPIIGVAETFRWGIWGSLSRENFQIFLRMKDDPKRAELPAMFSWLSSRMEEYPETLGLKMHAHLQEPGSRPHFRLEESDHPLAQEYHHGITPERVKQIMLRGLSECR